MPQPFGNILVGRFAMRLAAVPAGALNVDVVYITISGQGYPTFTLVDTPLRLKVTVGTGTPQYGPTLSLNTWYVIDFKVDSSGATTTFDWQVDAVAQTQATKVQTSTAISWCTFGGGYLPAGDTVDLFLDDIVLSLTAADYPFGAGLVLGFSPNADGTHDFTAGDFKYDDSSSILVAATDVNTYIDEKPVSGTTDYITQAVANTAGYVEFGFADTLIRTNPQGVEVVASLNIPLAGTAVISCKLNDSETIAAIWTSLNISETALAIYGKHFATAPASASAWTRADLNSLRMRYGYASDVIPAPNLHGVIIEVCFANSTQVVKALGTVWVEGTDFHYIDASNQERLVTGSTTA